MIQFLLINVCIKHYLYSTNASSFDAKSDNTNWATQYELIFQNHVCVSTANIRSRRSTLAEG